MAIPLSSTAVIVAPKPGASCHRLKVRLQQRLQRADDLFGRGAVLGGGEGHSREPDLVDGGAFNRAGRLPAGGDPGDRTQAPDQGAVAPYLQRLEQSLPEGPLDINQIEDLAVHESGGPARFTGRLVREKIEQNEGNRTACPGGGTARFPRATPRGDREGAGKLRLRRACFHCVACGKRPLPRGPLIGFPRLTCLQAPVQRPVLDAFRHVRHLDPVLTGQVGDGASQLEDAVVGAGGEPEALDGGF